MLPNNVNFAISNYTKLIITPFLFNIFNKKKQLKILKELKKVQPAIVPVAT